jgi:Domain of unknown function (DUF4166)
MNKEPIFKSIFGAQWAQLPLALQKRYANRPHSNDEVVVDGVLDVYVSKWIKLLSPLLRFCGALVPYAGNDIPVTVCFNSETDSDTLGFNRTFHFPGKPPYRFKSKLAPFGGDKVVEFMRFGLGWRMRYHFDGKKARLDHAGYIWHLGNISIPLPFGLILGKAHAAEEAISDDEFVMCFDIVHPLFGKVFGYHGKFKVTQVP